MRTRVAAIGAAIALAVGGLAACSSSQDVVRADAAGGGAGSSGVLERATVKTGDVDTAKIAVTVDASGVAGTSGAAILTGDGAIDNVANRSRFTFDLSQLANVLPSSAGIAVGALGDEPVEIVTDSSDIYLKVGTLGSFLGATSDKSWVKISADGAGSQLGAPLAAGTDVLKLLDGAGEVTTVGTEQVRGVDTTHYRGTLDVASALSKLPADEQGTVQDQLDQVGIDPSAVSFPVDVWIGQDDLVRRVQLGLDEAEVGTAGEAQATFTLELYDFGAPVEVTVPPADQVFTVDPSTLANLGDLAGLGR
jgi:hypothetical protein